MRSGALKADEHPGVLAMVHLSNPRVLCMVLTIDRYRRPPKSIPKRIPAYINVVILYVCGYMSWPVAAFIDLYYSCSDISGYNSTRCTRPFLCSYYIYGEGVWGEGAGAVDVPGSSRLYRRSNFIMGCAHISASTKTDRPRARPRICSMSSPNYN